MHLKIFGSRNSYSKTDKDASFMRIKEEKNNECDEHDPFINIVNFP